MYRLHVQPAGGEAFEHRLDEDSLIIGRASDSGLVIADRFLSRHHARLFLRGEQLFVEDLGSRNGTLLNEVQVSGTEEVYPGDSLKVSGSVIRILGDPRDETSSLLEARGMGDMTVLRHASDVLDSASSDSAQILGEDNLRRFAARLQLLNDVHSALGRSIELNELLELILERAFEHLKPEQGAIFLKEGDGDDFRLAARRSIIDDEYLYSRTLVKEVVEKGLAAVVLDAQTDERFADAHSIMAAGVRSLVAAPLLDPDGCLGMIVLSSRLQVRQFTEADMELLTSLASIATLRLRNVSLAEEAAERREMARELALARHIQVALLPDSLPEIPGWELNGGNVPSRGVSGDFYEVVERGDDGEFLTLVADVSGKGMSASLLAAALESMTAGPIEEGMAAELIFRRASRLLYQRTPPERYATAVLAAIRASTGELRFVNAGHVPGLLVRADGEIEQLEATGTPIGLLPDCHYTAAQTRLEPGDLLVLYSDGLSEAEDREEEQFGITRLADACSKHRVLPLPELAEAIEEVLDSFVGEVAFADDRTLVLIRRSAG